MATSPKKRVYWDSCVWIALIQREVVEHNGYRENRVAQCRNTIIAATNGGLEIVTSSITIAEIVSESTFEHPNSSIIAEFFEHDFILLVNVDLQLGTIARDLQRAGHPGLKPFDAIHIASAIRAQCEELHTYDGKLLDLDGKIDKPDGSKLRICKPDPGGPPLPLLREVA